MKITRFIFVIFTIMPLVFPIVNFTIVPNNIEFASVMGLFEEEHENEEFETETLKEIFHKIVNANNFFEKKSIWFLNIQYENTFYPQIIIPPPDLA